MQLLSVLGGTGNSVLNSASTGAKHTSRHGKGSDYTCLGNSYSSIALLTQRDSNHAFHSSEAMASGILHSPAQKY